MKIKEFIKYLEKFDSESDLWIDRDGKLIETSEDFDLISEYFIQKSEKGVTRSYTTLPIDNYDRKIYVIG